MTTNNVVTRAKVKLHDITTHYWSPTSKTLKFYPVSDDATPENQKFHRYTPSGSLELVIDNPAVNLVLGKEYYIDFIEAVN